jgi:hypothetical protein
MPNIRPITITPYSNGVSARRASIMSKKLGNEYNVIHQVGDSKYGKPRYHPCSSPQDFLKRYQKHVLKMDVLVDPKIYLNDRGEYVINI